MGSKASKSDKKTSEKKTRSKYESRLYERDFETINCIEKADIGLNLSTPPLLNGNEIIFLSTSNNKSSYSIYDLNKSEFTINSQEIKCDDDKFDVLNTVYTLNPNNNKIYFIENNKDIKVFDINKNKIISLNKSISTKYENVATIIYNNNNNNVHVIGAEKYMNIAEKTSNEYIPIPYSTATKQKSSNYFIECIKKTGLFARVINAEHDGSNCVYIVGGKKDYNNKGPKCGSIILPTDDLLILTLLDDKGKHDWRIKQRYTAKKIMTPLHTPYPMHSFGITNYKNIYLIIFGGIIFKKQMISDNDYIWILTLSENDKYGLKQYWWYQLHIKLPQKGCFHALYPENSKTVRVHLFSYDGKYYQIEMKDILDKLKNGHYNELLSWDMSPRIALPTKSKSLKRLGPKENSPIDSMLDELTKMDRNYERYKDAFINIDYEELEQIINDEDGLLEKVVENEKHRQTIIQKSMILSGYENSNTMHEKMNLLLICVDESDQLLVFGYIRESTPLMISNPIINYCLLFAFLNVSKNL